jgi:hypothetical protein
MRWDIINYLADNNKYKTYLEIGVQDYYSNCDKIKVEYKYAVDPAPKNKCDFIGTSDEFFAQHDVNSKFDLIFIDGLHQSDQVLKDINNSLAVLSDGGTIVVHDCLPEAEYQQVREDNNREWTGDVWKAVAILKGTREDLDIKVVDHDWGCGIIRRGSQELNKYKTLEDLNWKIFEYSKNSLMGVISPEEFVNKYKNDKA